MAALAPPEFLPTNSQPRRPLTTIWGVYRLFAPHTRAWSSCRSLQNSDW